MEVLEVLVLVVLDRPQRDLVPLRFEGHDHVDQVLVGRERLGKTAFAVGFQAYSGRSIELGTGRVGDTTPGTSG